MRRDRRTRTLRVLECRPTIGGAEHALAAPDPKDATVFRRCHMGRSGEQRDFREAPSTVVGAEHALGQLRVRCDGTDEGSVGIDGIDCQNLEPTLVVVVTATRESTSPIEVVGEHQRRFLGAGG